MTAGLTIVLVAYYGDKWLPACIDSLATASQRPVRLILVDNAGNRCISDLDLARFEHCVVRPPHRLGFSEANNFALGYTDERDEIICFLNQDTRGRAGWLDECIEQFHAEPQLGALSPAIHTYDWRQWDPAFWDCARGAAEFPANAAVEDRLRPLYAAPRITAAAMLVRNAVLRQVGPFDPIFGSYYEDYDLCRRIRRAGYTIGICGTARLAHFSGSSTSDRRAERRRARLIVRNRVIDRLREAGRHRLRAMLPYVFYRLPYNACRSLWGTPSSQPLSVLMGGHLDLLPILDRLLSERRDRQHWQAYLESLNWPPGELAAETTSALSGEYSA